MSNEKGIITVKETVIIRDKETKKILTKIHRDKKRLDKNVRK